MEKPATSEIAATQIAVVYITPPFVSDHHSLTYVEAAVVGDKRRCDVDDGDLARKRRERSIAASAMAEQATGHFRIREYSGISVPTVAFPCLESQLSQLKSDFSHKAVEKWNLGDGISVPTVAFPCLESQSSQLKSDFSHNDVEKWNLGDGISIPKVAFPCLESQLS
ncbi:hypothetical protein L1887_35555 [Cichorium endivia]|nr:hypothetical protein L1887_35555 [Cichorium endivia]